jgi:hypothetical protein
VLQLARHQAKTARYLSARPQQQRPQQHVSCHRTPAPNARADAEQRAQKVLRGPTSSSCAVHGIRSRSLHNPLPVRSTDHLHCPCYHAFSPADHTTGAAYLCRRSTFPMTRKIWCEIPCCLWRCSRESLCGTQTAGVTQHISQRIGPAHWPSAFPRTVHHPMHYIMQGPARCPGQSTAQHVHKRTSWAEGTGQRASKGRRAWGPVEAGGCSPRACSVYRSCG